MMGEQRDQKKKALFNLALFCLKPDMPVDLTAHQLPQH